MTNKHFFTETNIFVAIKKLIRYSTINLNVRFSLIFDIQNLNAGFSLIFDIRSECEI